MGSGRRGDGWVIAVGLAGAACTVINPAYDDSGAAPTEGSASVGDATAADATVTAGPPDDGPEGGDTLEGGGTLEGGDTLEGGGTLEGGSESSGVCTHDDDCSDGVFCNGLEACAPDKPDADVDGCVFIEIPCGDGQICDPVRDDCVTDCTQGEDFDGDGLDAENCGGMDCDDTIPDITVPGNDWAHCGGCGEACDPLEACQWGSCIPARRVFVSSTQFTGAMGGLAGADEACQQLADSMDLGGTFSAFLVDETGGLDRLEPAAVPYVRLDGATVAGGWGQLVGPGLLSPIDVDERRATHDGLSEWAWTGLASNLMVDENTCSNWTAEVEAGAVGDISSVAVAWRAAPDRPCEEPQRLYCIEQGDEGG